MSGESGTHPDAKECSGFLVSFLWEELPSLKSHSTDGIPEGQDSGIPQPLAQRHLESTKSHSNLQFPYTSWSVTSDLNWTLTLENKDAKKAGTLETEGAHALPARERWGSIACTHWPLFSLPWRERHRWVISMCGASVLSWLLFYGQWWEAAQRGCTGCAQRNHAKRHALWSWGICSSEGRAIRLTPHRGSTELAGSVTFWGPVEWSLRWQWILMPEQVEWAMDKNEEADKNCWRESSIRVFMCLGENTAISVQVKDIPTLWFRNSNFSVFLSPTDILVHVGKDVCSWILTAAFLAVS